jgi:hypothetical protein
MTDGQCFSIAAYKRETQQEAELFKKKECCKQSPSERWCPRTIGATYHRGSNMPGIPCRYRHISGRALPLSCRAAVRLWMWTLVVVDQQTECRETSSYPILCYFIGFLDNEDYFLRASKWMETRPVLSTEKIVKHTLLYEILSSGSNLLSWWEECDFIMLSVTGCDPESNTRLARQLGRSKTPWSN